MRSVATVDPTRSQSWFFNYLSFMFKRKCLETGAVDVAAKIAAFAIISCFIFNLHGGSESALTVWEIGANNGAHILESQALPVHSRLPSPIAIQKLRLAPDLPVFSLAIQIQQPE